MNELKWNSSGIYINEMRTDLIQRELDFSPEQMPNRMKGKRWISVHENEFVIELKVHGGF